VYTLIRAVCCRSNIQQSTSYSIATTHILNVLLQSIPTGLHAHPQGTDLANNSFGGVECTAHHRGSRGVADIMSVTMPLLSIKDLISTRVPAEEDPPLYKKRSKPDQAVCKGESGALN